MTVGRPAQCAPQTCNVVNICVNNAVVVMDVAMHCNAGDYYNVAIVPFFGRLWTSTTTLQPHRIVAVTIATLQRLDTAVAIACMRSVSRAIALAIYLCPPHPPLILPWYAFECCGTVDCHVAQITLYRTRNS